MYLSVFICLHQYREQRPCQQKHTVSCKLAGYQSPKLHVPFDCEDLKLLWLPSPADIQCAPRKEQCIHALNDRFQLKSSKMHFNKNMTVYECPRMQKITTGGSSKSTPSNVALHLFLLTFLKQNIASYFYFPIKQGCGYQVKVS